MQRLLSGVTFTFTTFLRIAPIAALVSTAATLPAHSQTGTATLPATVSTHDPCKADVIKFEETIGFIRNAQGNTAAAALRERMLPAKTQTELLSKDGYCGVARYLREKKLIK